MKKALALILVSVLVGAAGADPIGVYIDDDFGGSSLNPATWCTEGSGTITVDSSKVSLQGVNWSANARMYSENHLQFLPEAGQEVILTSTDIATQNYGNGVYWGFAGSGDNRIHLLADSIEGYSWATTLNVKYNGTDQKVRLLGDNELNGEFSIAWSTDNIKVWRDDTLLFDLQEDAPSMQIPTVVMRVYAESWCSQIQMGSAHLEIVPEPATMSLLAVGGLSVLLRRKRS